MADINSVLISLTAHVQGCGHRTELCDAFNCAYRDDANGCDIEQMCIDAIRVIKGLYNKIAEMKAIYGDQGRVVGALVRCKDCKHWYKDECSHLCILTGELRKADFFCADGEKKDE